VNSGHSGAICVYKRPDQSLDINSGVLRPTNNRERWELLECYERNTDSETSRVILLEIHCMYY